MRVAFDMTDLQLRKSLADSNGMMGSMMQDLAFAIPGVDEAMSFAEIMKSVIYPAAQIAPKETATGM